MNKDVDNFSENASSESSLAAKQEATRQNALLKQLLQNCPSADLSLSKNSATNSEEPKIKIENDVTPHQCMGESSSHGESILKHSDSMDSSSAILNENSNSETFPTGDLTPGSNSLTSPMIEKKMSYLDIRRAQLEKDPTPPPEDMKPKRKRVGKRKDSAKSIDENENGQQVTGKPSKKRSRKGSQNKNEEICSENSEQALASVINQLRSKPSVQIVEPAIKNNLNVCLPPDASDQNCFESKLKGCYGNAFLSSTIDYYSTYPFGPKKASVVPTAPSNSTNNHNRGFYSEEFDRNIPDLIEHFNERNDTTSRYIFHDRDVDSPETIVSASSPESMFYDTLQDDYCKMKFINDKEVEEMEEQRMSPLIPFTPIRPTPVYANGIQDYDKENRPNNKIVKLNKVGVEYPLKENGNVEITLMLTSEQDIRSVLVSLAKILKVSTSFTYSIENSSTFISEVLDIDRENCYCKFCDCLIQTDQNGNGEIDSYIKNAEDAYFCNKDCFKKYTISVNFVDFETEKRPVPSLLEHKGNDQNEEKMDLDEMEISINVEEKRWKNTRYLYWNKSSFKNHQDNVDQDNSKELAEQLDVCLKPVKNSVEKRVCIFCHEQGDGDPNGSSRLLNMDVDKWVHLNCALWSYEVYEMMNGALMNVEQAYRRSMDLPCVKCAKVGASLKCFKLRCNSTYHFPCAIKDKCMFTKDKTVFCPAHSPKASHSAAHPEELSSFLVERRVYINRDEQKQIAAMIHQGDNNLMRIGSLIFFNIGQLLPHQLQNFHSNTCIYPVGYKVSRFYWSTRRLGKRCQYICSINEVDAKPEFSIEMREEGFENETFLAATPKQAWQKIIESISKLREESQTIKVFFDFITGEDLFGLTEPAVIRILESLPGVDTLYDYNFKYGRSPWYELPLAINPTGCARTEPKMRTHFKRPHTLHVSSNATRSSIQSSLSSGESSSPYVKQFVHSKISQYRKMKQEWRNNVYLARSRIQGLGLYAVRDIEKHTMIIEYIGLLIRNEIAERNERVHTAHVSRTYTHTLTFLSTKTFVYRIEESTCSGWTITE